MRFDAVCVVCCLFLIHPATTEIYTLSLHDALPIYGARARGGGGAATEDQEACRHERRSGSVLAREDRKSTRLNSSHLGISYAVFCLKKKIKNKLVMSPLQTQQMV